MIYGFVDIEEIEKYNQWRANHPLEAPKLPEIELR